MTQSAKETQPTVNVDSATPAPPTTERVRFSLRAKLALMASLVAIVPLAAIGALLINVNAESLSRESETLRRQADDKIADSIQRAFDDATQGLLAVAQALTQQNLGDDGKIALASSIVNANPALDQATVYALDGSVIDTFWEDSVARGTIEPLDDVTRKAAVERDVFVGKANVEPQGAPRVLVVVPILVDKKATGYVGSRISLEFLQAKIVREATASFEGRPDSIVVVDADLRILAHPDASKSRALVSASDGPIVKLMEKATFQTDLIASSEDGGAFATMTVLAKERWAVIAQVPRDVVYASLGRLRVLVGLSILGAIVVATLAALIFAQRLTRPIESLVAFTQKLAQRKFGERIVVDTNDELAVLGRALSGAAHDLQDSEARILKETAIRTDLGRYLPIQLVDRVVRREQEMGLGGARRDITVLFADVVGFTPLSEKLAPEAIVDVLNDLFTILTEIVFRHGGTVDKFIGDCVMAFWGAPEAQEDHASRALDAAKDMLRFIEIGNARWKKKHGIEIQLAIGVNSGAAIVGNIGSEVRLEYTAIGEVVNLAARLEAIARPQQILLTSSTKDAAGDMHDFIDIGLQQLAGRSTKLNVYSVEP
jgi:class 3 adenylate cyclase